ncbi:MAG: hypothetical protein ABFS09_04095 [Thermodesulfobacteriota bacterium]
MGGNTHVGCQISFSTCLITSAAEGGDNADPALLTQVPSSIFFQKTLGRKAGDKTEGLGQHLLAKPMASAKTREAESA